MSKGAPSGTVGKPWDKAWAECLGAGGGMGLLVTLLVALLAAALLHDWGAWGDDMAKTLARHWLAWRREADLVCLGEGLGLGYGCAYW